MRALKGTVGLVSWIALVVTSSRSADFCGESGESSLLQLSPKQACTPIAYLKTHKTGSSTMQSILLRLAVRRRMEIFWPDCSGDFNYPSHFPGPMAEKVPANHQFDMILHHAVLNVSAFRSYLKPSAFFVTVLREPVSQMTSVFNWYRRFYNWASLDEFIDYLATSPEEQQRPRRIGRHLGIARNFQARDLGFYESGGRANSTDAEVASWIKSLSDVFSYPSTGLVVIKERYDEGLILLQQALRVDLEDVSYMAMRVQDASSTKYEEPTARQSRRIRDLANIDAQVYDHFRQTFEALWEDRRGSAKLDDSIGELRQVNDNLTTSCRESNGSHCELFVEDLPELRNMVRQKLGLETCARPGKVHAQDHEYMLSAL
ncbi:Gal3st3 [Symbiodinium necroappetens]|uniref:Gal3st3 protein n=1 Tax=Symbiodinium necroappetens TaxID=1628268 RepID=A0A812Z5Z5_9DINO|nr:Gal3st3 [Symbiodinium necroappetens]